MEGAAGRRGLPGAGWLPERPRSASLIASLTAVPSSAPTSALPSLSASRRRSESPARPAAQAREPRARCPPSAFPARRERGGAGREGSAGEMAGWAKLGAEIRDAGSAGVWQEKLGAKCLHVRLHGWESSVITKKIDS